MNSLVLTKREMTQMTNLIVLRSMLTSRSMLGRWTLTATVLAGRGEHRAVHLAKRRRRGRLGLDRAEQRATGWCSSDSMTDTTWLNGAGGLRPAAS